MNDPVADLDFAPKVVYTDAASFQWTTFANDFFRARRRSSDLRDEGNRPTSSGNVHVWILGRLRSFLHPHDVYAAPSETSMDDLSTRDSDQQSSISGFVVETSVHCDEGDVPEDPFDRQANPTLDSDGMSIQISSASVTSDSEEEQQPLANQIPPSASCTDITSDAFNIPSSPATSVSRWLLFALGIYLLPDYSLE